MKKLQRSIEVDLNNCDSPNTLLNSKATIKNSKATIKHDLKMQDIEFESIYTSEEGSLQKET